MSNKIYLEGRAVAQPELKYLPSGSAIATFSIADDYSYKKNNEWQKETSFHRVTIFGKQAESASGIVKGDLLHIEGRLLQRTWEDKDGKKRSAHEINASKVRILSYLNSSDSYSQSSEQSGFASNDIPF